MDPDSDDPVLHGAIAARLVPLDPAAERAGELRLSLFDRVRKSVDAHREYRTVRVEDGAWRHDANGVARRTLRDDADMRVDVLMLADGAILPWPDDAKAQEVLVLDGALDAAADAASSPEQRRSHAYRVRDRTDPGEPLRAIGACTVYVRHLLVDPARLPDLEAHWWRLPGPSSGWVDPARRRWHRTAEGVEVLPLRGDGDVVSMLVRFAPGASVPDHRHALHEDCLVLEGEMFLGDILLRTGDYQLAPAGGSHFGETSDVGALFFFHGALDPVLRGDAPG
jgi:anti-sigma factor ChrR (cupin superfamily)